MESFSLDAEPRAGGSKNDSHKVRKAGGTPGVMYRAGAAATPIRFDGKALASIFRKTNNANTLLRVNVAGASRTCIVREIQRHPVSRAVEHVDFYEVAKGELVTVIVPVLAVGRAAGTRAGGTLRNLARFLTVKCDPYAIPATLDVDVTPLEVGQFVKASQVPLPGGVSILYAQDFNLFTVEGKLAPEAAPAAAAAATAGAPAAAAAGKAPAAAAGKAPAAAAKPAAKK